MPPRHPLIGPDLQQLIAMQGSPLVCVQEMTSLQSDVQRRASFKLSFEDGRVLKGRRFRSLERCRTAATLAPLLAGFPVNQVIDSQGDSWIEQWVEGTPLQFEDTTQVLCRWAGELMGRIHRRPVAGIELPTAGAKQLLDRLAYNLGEVVNHGGMEQTQSDALMDLARAEQPADFETGLIHTDLTVNNLVTTPEGTLVVVDNEHLMLGAFDYDLTRTFCRWPMTETQRQAFCEGYRRHRNPDTAIEQQVFWSVLSLAQSARVRMRHQSEHRHLIKALDNLAAGKRAAIWPTLA